MNNLTTAASRMLEYLGAWSNGERVDSIILGNLILQLEGALIQSANEKFCDSNCVWTNHHPNCALGQLEPEPWMGVSDNPYVNDNDCNDPNGRAMRWYNKLQAILLSNTKKPELLQEALETRLRLRSFEEAWDAPGMEAYDDLPLAQPARTGQYSDIVSDGGFDPRNAKQPESEPFGWLYESKTGNRIFHLVSDDKRAFHADFEAAQQYPEGHKMTPLYTAPPPAESKSFNPDWDRVQALEESLREHMAEIHRLRGALHSIVKADANDELGIEENLLATVKCALVQPKQTTMPPDIAKVLFENVESLYVEDAQLPTKWTPMTEYASKSAAMPGRAEMLDRIKKALCQLQEKTLPEEPVAWEMDKRGRTIQDNDWTHDVVLRVDGDFESDSQRIEYARAIVYKLNAAPPVRKLLTDEEINKIAEDGLNGYDRFTFTRAIEKAHGIGSDT